MGEQQIIYLVPAPAIHLDGHTIYSQRIGEKILDFFSNYRLSLYRQQIFYIIGGLILTMQNPGKIS
jgi:hypothetical protein